MKSNHLFSRIPRAEIPRSSFNRDHSYKTTCDAGKLIPIFVDEVLPGDTFNLKCNLFSRITTLVVPVMDNIYFDTQFFFVPCRLVWSNFKKFMGEQISPTDSIDYLVPTINSGASGFSVGSIYDYMGIPTGVANLDVNALPLRAYNLIYQEWYKDENLINAPAINTGDGPDTATDYTVRNRGKRHDYFTSCLPWPQKGPGVSISLGDSAPLIVPSGQKFIQSDGPFKMIDNNEQIVWTPAGTNFSDNYSQSLTAEYNNNSTFVEPSYYGAMSYHSGIKFNSSAYADLSQATPVTINSLRTAFQLQKFQEKCARGGTRYTEQVRSHFGVVSPDARLQRPEYLGGSSSIMQIGTVMQTSATGDTGTPQANLAAYGVLGSNTHGFVKSFTEHGYIIGIMSIRTDLTYQQGLNKMWSRQTREDFYWPSFAHLGEQAVLNKEIYAQGKSVVDSDGNIIDDKAFGYQERYAEYRYYPNMITGKLRSTAIDSLDVWHLAQEFESLPTLNQTFIEESVPMSRVLAVANQPAFKVDCYFKMKCVRPMPVYSVPGLVDHF